jgi:Zn-dependent protease with chaperone function
VRRNAFKLAAISCTLAVASCTPVRTTSPGVVGVERKAVMLVSSSKMNQMAESSYQDVIGKARARGQLNRDPVMAKRVRDVADRLLPHVTVFRADAAGWNWEVNVIHEATLNAWCMPGGKIAFYSGIIDKLKLTDEEIAAIMGHEIAHALREHGRERVSQQLVAKVGLNAATLFTKTDVMGANQMAQVMQVAWLLPNSRAHETESDRMGVELAARAGYDPRAAIRVWEKMRALGGGGGPEFMSTHPSHETRINDLTEYSQKVMPLYEAAKAKHG